MMNPKNIFCFKISLKRRYMSLLELLIAMGLSVIILTTLTYFYRDVDSMNREMDRHQKESFQNLFVENRLANILPRALSEKKGKKDFFFFTNSAFGEFLKSGNPHLIFSFDNGNMLDKDFSNNVIGMLYLDTQDRLCLAIWPAPRRWPAIGLPPLKKEILLENVEQLKFSFYIPPEKDRKKWGVNIPPLEVQGPWVSEWRSDYKQLPTMIKIELVKKIDSQVTPITFAFPFPNSEKFIIYNK